MLQMLIYDKASKIRQHLTLSSSRACEADVASRYNVRPIKREDASVLHLDPGGFAFSDTEPIEFEVGQYYRGAEGRIVKVAVKPEHVHHILDLSTRTLKGQQTETGGAWTKVYLGWCCLVLPTATWEAITQMLESLARKHDHGDVQLAVRMAR